MANLKVGDVVSNYGNYGIIFNILSINKYVEVLFCNHPTYLAGEYTKDIRKLNASNFTNSKRITSLFYKRYMHLSRKYINSRDQKIKDKAIEEAKELLKVVENYPIHERVKKHFSNVLDTIKNFVDHHSELPSEPVHFKFAYKDIVVSKKYGIGYIKYTSPVSIAIGFSNPSKHSRRNECTTVTIGIDSFADVKKIDNFMDSLIAGDVTQDEIDDIVDIWHDGNMNLDIELHKLLGMSEEEYRQWAMKNISLSELLNARKSNTPSDINWTGTWKVDDKNEFGRSVGEYNMLIIQKGNKVIGKVQYLTAENKVTINGEVSGDTLSGKWTNGLGICMPNGPFTFKMSPDNKSFKGEWSSAISGSKGTWNGLLLDSKEKYFDENAFIFSSILKEFDDLSFSIDGYLNSNTKELWDPMTSIKYKHSLHDLSKRIKDLDWEKLDSYHAEQFNLLLENIVKKQKQFLNGILGLSDDLIESIKEEKSSEETTESIPYDHLLDPLSVEYQYGSKQIDELLNNPPKSPEQHTRTVMIYKDALLSLAKKVKLLDDSKLSAKGIQYKESLLADILKKHKQLLYTGINPGESYLPTPGGIGNKLYHKYKINHDQKEEVKEEPSSIPDSLLSLSEKYKEIIKPVEHLIVNPPSDDSTYARLALQCIRNLDLLLKEVEDSYSVFDTKLQHSGVLNFMKHKITNLREKLLSEALGIDRSYFKPDLQDGFLRIEETPVLKNPEEVLEQVKALDEIDFSVMLTPAFTGKGTDIVYQIFSKSLHMDFGDIERISIANIDAFIHELKSVKALHTKVYGDKSSEDEE